MYIKKEKENWNLEDTIKFISNCLIAYERINVKDQNKLICLEEDFDTLDFNEVPYLLRNEFEVPEYVIDKIRNLETLIKQLYFEKEIKGELRKNSIIFLLNYNNRLYNINYDGNVIIYSKSKKDIKNIENNDYIINFEYLKKYLDENQNGKRI